MRHDGVQFPVVRPLPLLHDVVCIGEIPDMEKGCSNKAPDTQEFMPQHHGVIQYRMVEPPFRTSKDLLKCSDDKKLDNEAAAEVETAKRASHR